MISIELGFAKPAAEVFERAAEGLGFRPNQILQVGDSPKEDVAGAQRAGFRAVLLAREKKGTDESIGSLRELRGLL